MKVRKALPIKLILLGILPLVFVSVITAIYSLTLTIELRKSTLKSISDSVSEHIETYYNSQKSNLEFSAKIPTFIDLLNSTQLDSTSQEALTLLNASIQLINSNVQTNVDLEIINITDAKGTVIVSSKPEIIGLNFANQSSIKDIQSAPTFYQKTIINPDNSRFLSLAVPIRDFDDHIIGYMNRISNLDDITQYIKNFRIGKTGYLYLFDSDGTTLSHHFEDRVTSTEDTPKEVQGLMNDIQNKTLSNDTGFFDYKISNVSFLGSYESIELPQWVIVSAIEKSELYQEVYGIFLIVLITTFIVSFLSAFIGKQIANSVVNPLSYLNQKITAIANGDLTVRCKLKDNKDEFNDLAHSINDMAFSLETTTNVLLETNERLNYIAHYDALTDIPNRKSIYDFIEKHFRTSENQAVILFDLDGFKKVNDTLGHEAGDIVLQKVGLLLKEIFSETIYPARLGGDEFLIFISNFKDLESVEDLLNLILKGILEINEINETSISISASLGISLLKKTTLNKGDLIKDADDAMYQAKKSGGNTFLFSD